MKFNYRVTAVLAGLLSFVSCAAKTDDEAIRLYAQASETYSQGRLAETADLLRGIKKFPPGLALRAKAEYFSGELENAEKSFLLAIKYRPSAFEAKIYLARILREKGKTSEAIKLVESLLADNPRDIRALRLAFQLADDEGKSDEAAAFLDKAAELSAESAMVLLDRARIRWTAGRDAEALEDLGRARAMLPWDTPLFRSITNLENSIKAAHGEL